METIKTLINLLESNGFEPSDENLEILSEDLENGNTIILDSSDISLIENMDEDYFYMQILSNNGFKVNENNLSVLKEAMENGHILLSEESKSDKKEKRNKAGRRIARTIIGTALGAAAGMGLAAATKGVSDTVAKNAETNMTTAVASGKIDNTLQNADAEDLRTRLDNGEFDNNINTAKSNVVSSTAENRDAAVADLDKATQEKKYAESKVKKKTANDISNNFSKYKKGVTYGLSAAAGGATGATAGAMSRDKVGEEEEAKKKYNHSTEK